MTWTPEQLITRLEAKAKRVSEIERELAEAKGLRQSRPDRNAYIWPKPEETDEGQAAAMIRELALAAGIDPKRQLPLIPPGTVLDDGSIMGRCGKVAFSRGLIWIKESQLDRAMEHGWKRMDDEDGPLIKVGKNL